MISLFGLEDNWNVHCFNLDTIFNEARPYLYINITTTQDIKSGKDIYANDDHFNNCGSKATGISDFWRQCNCRPLNSSMDYSKSILVPLVGI